MGFGGTVVVVAVAVGVVVGGVGVVVGIVGVAGERRRRPGAGNWPPFPRAAHAGAAGG